MRRTLSAVYTVAGVLSALCIVTIVLIILAQVAGRWLGVLIRGADDLVAWFTAAATFLGLPYAFAQGAHIRVDLVLGHLKGRRRRLLEFISLIGADIMTGAFAVASVQMTWESYQYNELAQGQLPVPMWIPQMSLALGATILFIAMLEATVQVGRGFAPAHQRCGEEEAHQQLRVEA